MIRHQAAALGIFFVLAGFATQARSQPTTTPTSPASTQPVYSVAYRVPTVDDLTRTLDQIRKRLDRATPVRMIDSGTRQEITDFSKPGPSPAMDRGPEQKFPLISYPMGVINSGMLLCAEATGDKKFSDFVAKRYQFYADHYADVEKWDQERGRSPFHPFYHPDSLDSCGSMGAAMVKAKRAGVGPDLSPIINRWAEYVHKEQFRLDDGTLARNRPFPNSLWGDDMYMSVPLLSQYGKLTGNNEYFDDAAKQVLQMSKYLFDGDKGMYAHAWNAGNPTNHPRYYWGRANGWCMVAMVELLEVLPENHPQRADIIKQLRLHAAESPRDNPPLACGISCSIARIRTSKRAAPRCSPTRWPEASTEDGSTLARTARSQSPDGMACKPTSPTTAESTRPVSARATPMTRFITTIAPPPMTSTDMDRCFFAAMITLMKNDHFTITGSRGGPIMVNVRQ